MLEGDAPVLNDAVEVKEMVGDPVVDGEGETVGDKLIEVDRDFEFDTLREGEVELDGVLDGEFEIVGVGEEEVEIDKEGPGVAKQLVVTEKSQFHV